MKTLQKFIDDNRTVKITEIDYNLAKEIQTVLTELDLYDSGIDGRVGVNTIKAFKRFKELNYQTSPDLLGKGSAELLLAAIDKNTTPVIEEAIEVIAPDAGYEVGKIDWYDFSCPVSKYFTVGEVVHGDRRRVPTSQANIKKILLIAKELDKIRADFGQPIMVTSWNRPPKINAAVGGARYSQHIQGWAVDIKSSGNLYEFQKWVDAYWYGALGFGADKGFVHVDPRNDKGWKFAKNSFVKGVRWDY